MSNPPWLLVSKPLRPPHADGTSALVGTLVRASPPTQRFVYLGDPAAPLRTAGLDRVVRRGAMGHAPTLVDKAGVLGQLLRPSLARLPVHLFFTPNTVTSGVVRALRRLTPRRPMLQTVTAGADAERMVPALSGLDAVIVLSESTRRALVAAGLDATRVHRIYPGVEPSATGQQASGRRLLYAGDLDERTAARLIACARALSTDDDDGWQLVIASRPKGDGDAPARALLQRELHLQIERGHVELHGHVAAFDALMASCRCQLFVADHLRRKVDLPLAILEGLSRGLGLLALDFAPINEIFDVARMHGLDVGHRLQLGSSDAQLAEEVRAQLSVEGRISAWHEGARRLISDHFSAATMAEHHQELYARLHGHHG